MNDLKREVIPFTNEADWLLNRTKDLTSTDIPALFGLSPYHTQRTLWESKKNPDPTPIEPSKRMKAGQKLEAAIAELIAEENAFTIEPFKDYIRLPDLRLGSSFDYKIKWDAGNHEEKILEIKNVSGQFFKSWFNKDNLLEPPYHISLQIQHQLLVSGLSKVVVGVLFGGNDYYTIEHTANPQIQELILKRSKEFWESVDNNTPPAFDYENKIDQELIKSIYAKAVEGKHIELDAGVASLAEHYLEAKKQISFLTEQAEAMKSQILEAIGDAEEATGNGYKVTAKIQKKKEYVVKASESRVIRITGPKE